MTRTLANVNTWHNDDGSGGNNAAAVLGLWRVGEWLRHGGLRSVQLDAVGWVALLSPGVVLGLLFARLTDRSFWVFGAIGGITIWTLAALLDNFRYGRQPHRLSTELLSDDALDRLMEASRHAGINVDHESRVLDDGETVSELTTQQRFVARLHGLVSAVTQGEATRG